MRTPYNPNRLTAPVAHWVSQVSYPCTCPVCGGVMDNATRAWCDACAPRVVRLRDPICMTCHRYLADNAECSSSHPTASPTVLIALGLFDHAWRGIVHAFKYQAHKALVNPLAKRLGEMVVRFPDSDAVVPIPTDPRKIADRDFGHAELLAETVAQEVGLAYIPKGLKQTRRLTDQTRLTGKERADNLRGALAVPDQQVVADKTIILVDDVTTTGATLREAARALTLAGARSVVGAVIAANFGNLPDGR